MRIVGGIYKGRIFSPNKQITARPTTDIAKEGLFNILQNRVDFADKKILDLFSGTGSIGYEFISRGAAEVTFVEKNPYHCRFINSVIDNFEIKNAKVFKTDAFKFLYKFQGQFDIVFADPPYDLPQFKEVPLAVFSGNVLKMDGLFILEHPKEYNFITHPNFSEIRNYGKVNFSFFQK